jgi:hypothetical protein
MTKRYEKFKVQQQGNREKKKSTQPKDVLKQLKFNNKSKTIEVQQQEQNN